MRCTTVWVRACEESVACSRPFPYRSTRASLRILSPPWHSRTSSLHFSSHFLYDPHLVHTYHKYFHNSDCRWQIPSQTPSHPTVPLTDPLKDPLTPHSPAHRSPYRPPHTSQISHRFWSQISHRFILASAREPPAPHITKASTMFFNFGVSSKQPGSVAGGRKLQFYLVNCRFSHRRLPLRGERNLWEICNLPGKIAILGH